MLEPAESLFLHGRRQLTTGQEGDAGIAVKGVNTENIHEDTGS
jgi:hypothetical protein